MALDARRKLEFLVLKYGSAKKAQVALDIPRPTWARWLKQNRIPGRSDKLIEQLINNG